jgi:hypothetical protein
MNRFLSIGFETDISQMKMEGRQRNAHRVVMWMPKGKRSFQRPRKRWEGILPKLILKK